MRVLIYIDLPVRAWSISDAHAAMLPAAFPDLEFIRARTVAEALEAIRDVEVSFSSRLTAEIVDGATRLAWVHSSAAAVEGLLPLSALAARGIAVTNSRGVQAVPIAEHVMGGLLLLARRYDRTMAAQQERRWMQHDLTLDWPWMLSGKRMTVVGLGTIGLEIAKRAHAFGITVTGVRRTDTADTPAFVERVVTPSALDDALTNCDILVLAAPGVRETHHMIGPRQLARLNPGALLVNVARAGIVDQDAMRDALTSGHLGGAVLDVFEREPLPPDDPLWTTPNTIITPHSAGFRATHWDDVIALFGEQLRRYRRGETLLNRVDLAAGY